jgi:hypothetical protein
VLLLCQGFAQQPVLVVQQHLHVCNNNEGQQLSMSCSARAADAARGMQRKMQQCEHQSKHTGVHTLARRPMAAARCLLL